MIKEYIDAQRLERRIEQSDLRRVRVVTDAAGLPHVYVIGTAIELQGVISCNVTINTTECPVARIEILEPEVEIKPIRKV